MTHELYVGIMLYLHSVAIASINVESEMVFSADCIESALNSSCMWKKVNKINECMMTMQDRYLKIRLNFDTKKLVNIKS